MKHVEGAAQFTPITLQEMETFLKRAFHALRLERGEDRGEVTLQLHFSDRFGVRILTTVPAQGDRGRGVGQDAIRVQLYNFSRRGPLKPGKPKIVKRTQGWRDSLKDRIEEAMEDYDSHEEEIEAGKFIRWDAPSSPSE